jgi:hypothetical protein
MSPRPITKLSLMFVPSLHYCESHDLKGADVIARGALLGAFVGDASGATLEFLGRKSSNEDVERALSMVGGGCWRV